MRLWHEQRFGFVGFPMPCFAQLIEAKRVEYEVFDVSLGQVYSHDLDKHAFIVNMET